MKHTTDPAAIYRAFHALPGSEYIASEYAIGAITAWVRKLRPRRVLEVGAGIGTLTFALCSLRREVPFELIAVEWNEFCQAAMVANLADQAGEYRHVTSMDGLENRPSFDVVIVDGGEQDPRFVSNLAPGATILIEGFMDKKHALIRETHSARAYVRTNFRSRDRTKGIWVFRFEPSLWERAWFAANNLANRVYSAAKRRGWA